MDLKRANQVFPVLEAWYNNNYSDSAGERPPLIIILEDFEGFASHILQDFILNLV